MEVAMRALQDSSDEAIRAIDTQFYAAVVLAAVAPLIEASALEKAAQTVEKEFRHNAIAAAIRALIAKDSGGGD
jgi:ABC-type xylose transport system permease subunit